jgi:hypothetical protein
MFDRSLPTRLRIEEVKHPFGEKLFFFGKIAAMRATYYHRIE